MNKNLKIAIYSGTVPSTTFIERLIHGLAKKGCQVFLFGVQNKKTYRSANIHYYTYTNKLNKFFQFIKYSLLLRMFKSSEKKKLDKIILSKNKNSNYLKLKYYAVLYHRPDIFHLQWAKGIEDWMWVQDFGIKLIVSLRGTHITISPIGNNYWKEIYSKYFSQIDGFHAVSKSMIDKAQGYGADLSKTGVIKSGLDLNILPFKSITKKSKSLRILSVGRSHWTKGYSYALDAIYLLKRSGIDFHYTIIGVEEDEELLYQRSQLGLESDVKFIEKLHFNEVLKSMKAADVLLLSSVEEGIANVVLEAMALGTLVISTVCGGMDEVVSDNENGFLVPIRDAVAISSALQRVSGMSLEEYQKMTKAARITIEKQHALEKMVVEMQAFYQRVLNKEL